ncbi:MAG: cbb3-type cytochrome c oxidase N-terminal domain-containing protein [Deltaproteobacteria bacterium]
MWKKIIQNLTKATPVENEQDVMLDHDYDGIKELDNTLPPWWLWLFYFTILFAVIYLIRYHVTGTWTSGKEYEQEMEIAKADVEDYLEKSGLNIDASTVTLKDDAATLDAGLAIFTKNCVACHRPDGGGIVGPNLTDDKWIHGGDIKDLFKTISEGVPAKGMQTWKGTLSAQQIQQVASYILIKLKGTNPTNPFAYPGDPK